MDIKQLFLASDRWFSDTLAKVKSDQWSDPTPDTDWSVHDLVNHVIGEELWLPDLVAGKTVAEVGDKYDGDVAGDDPKAAWQKAAAAAKTAVDGLSDVKKIVHLSFGDVPAEEYLTQMIIDRTIHGWDLAKAIGASSEIPQDLVDYSYGQLKSTAESWRSAGIFGAEVKLPDSPRDQDKLLALSGRQP